MSQIRAAAADSSGLQALEVDVPIDELKRLVLNCVATQGHSKEDSAIVTEVCVPDFEVVSEVYLLYIQAHD